MRFLRCLRDLEKWSKGGKLGKMRKNEGKKLPQNPHLYTTYLTYRYLTETCPAILELWSNYTTFAAEFAFSFVQKYFFLLLCLLISLKTVSVFAKQQDFRLIQIKTIYKHNNEYG